MFFRITGANSERTQQVVGELFGEDLNDDQSSVLNKIFQWMKFVTIDDDNVVFVAEGSESDGSGATWSFRGIITLSKNAGVWFINDLVSLGGVGGKLAAAAYKYISEHPAGGVHRGKVSLLSLNTKSDTFWQRQGFDFVGTGPSGRTTTDDPVPMEKDLNAPVVHPVAPDLSRSPPISRSRSASASGSSSPTLGDKKDF